MVDILEKIKTLKQDVERATSKYHEAQGEQKALLSRLKTEYGVDTVEQAQTLLESEKKKLGKMEAALEEEVRELEATLQSFKEALT